MCGLLVPRRVLAALVQSVVLVVVTRLGGRGRQREWCTEDYKTTDCYNELGIQRSRSNGTDLKIVLPSFGQTGTTTVIMALRKMGVRAFHADDYSVYAKPVMFDEVNWGFWARTVSRCRMEAISLEPLSDMLPMAVAMAPDAKFILTWRPFPAWFKSTTSSRVKEIRWSKIDGPLLASNAVFPWVETFDQIFGVIRRTRMEADPYFGSFSWLAYLYRLLCNGYSWPIHRVNERGTYKCYGQEEAYLAHINEIRMLVPKERLLEFDVTRHGWGDLEQFLFGRQSERARQPLPRPRSKNMRTNEPLLESNLRITFWAYFLFAVLHALNYFVIGLIMRVPAMLLRSACQLLLGSSSNRPSLDPEPTGARERWEAALGLSPVLAILEGVEQEHAVAVGQALFDAGIRVVAMPLNAPEALQSLQLLARAVPKGMVVGASGVVAANQVDLVYKAGGSLVLSPNTDCHVIERTKRLGLVSLPGTCTPTEALLALRHGADGLNAFPAELVAPSVVEACRNCLPEGTRIVATGATSPEAMAQYWAAGVSGFGVGAVLLQPGDAPALIGSRAEAFLAACRSSRPSAARAS